MSFTPESRKPGSPATVSALAMAMALLLTLPLLSACTPTTTASVSTGAASQTRASFESASVDRLDAPGSYRIDWQGSQAVDKVAIYAGTTNSPVTTGKPVATGVGRGSATVTGLAPGQRWYFTLVPDHGRPVLIGDRNLHLATAPNFRDVGGYRTTDGRWVRMGRIYRSDQLDRLSDPDLAAIAALGVNPVVDLRTASERTREPDRLAPGIRSLVLDVAADSSGTLGGDMRKAQAAIASGKGAEMLIEANRDFVSLPSARTAYGRLLTELTDGQDKAIVYHCTAGKDRTGWATAVILTILGVSRDQVIADYLLSNRYLEAKNAATIAGVKALGAPINPAFLEPVLTVRRDYLQSAFDEVDRKYGSFDAYVRDGLGISDAQVDVLRRIYLSD